MAGGRSRLNFETSADAGYKTVKRVIGVELFLAAGITDGDGKKSNRLLIRAAGDTQFYFLFPKGVEEAMKPASPWLQELMEHELGSQTNEPIPEDSVSVPTGDPLEG